MTLAIELNVYPEQFERIVEMTLADFKACVEQLKMDEEAFNLDLSDAQVDGLIAKHFLRNDAVRKECKSNYSQNSRAIWDSPD